MLKETRFVQRLMRPVSNKAHNFSKYPTDKQRLAVRERIDLSNEAWEALDEVCTFDWMMCPYYDSEAVGTSLEVLMEDELVGFKINLNKREIAPHYRRVASCRRYNRKEKKRREEEGLKPMRWNKKAIAKKERGIWVICRKGTEERVNVRIRNMAKDKCFSLRETDKFSRSLDPWDYTDKWICGWLELDNHFFFTTVEDMYDGFAEFLEPEWLGERTNKKASRGSMAKTAREHAECDGDLSEQVVDPGDETARDAETSDRHGESTGVPF